MKFKIIYTLFITVLVASLFLETPMVVPMAMDKETQVHLAMKHFQTDLLVLAKPVMDQVIFR